MSIRYKIRQDETLADGRIVKAEGITLDAGQDAFDDLTVDIYPVRLLKDPNNEDPEMLWQVERTGEFNPNWTDEDDIELVGHGSSILKAMLWSNGALREEDVRWQCDGMLDEAEEEEAQYLWRKPIVWYAFDGELDREGNEDGAAIYDAIRASNDLQEYDAFYLD